MQITVESITNIRTPKSLATVFAFKVTENEVDPIYAKGYQDAAELQWNTFPLDMIVPVIDSYREMALKHGNRYIAGMAQGAWDLFVGRIIN
jgi:hypothetical protein